MIPGRTPGDSAGRPEMPRLGWMAVALLAAGMASPVAAQPLGPLEPVAPFPPPGGQALPSTPVTPNPPERSSTSNYQPPPILGAPVGVVERTVTPTRFVDEPVQQPPPQRGAR